MNFKLKRFLWGLGLMLISVGNLLAFGIGSGKLGGAYNAALSQDGRYFVSSRDGQREVSRLAYEYSRWHTYSLALTFPLGMVGMWILFYSLPRGRRFSAAH